MGRWVLKMAKNASAIAAAAAMLVSIPSFVGAQAEEVAPLAVRTMTATFEDTIETQQAYVGRVSPRRTSTLAFDRAGMVQSLTADEGDFVAAGAVIATLDLRRLEADRTLTEAQLAEAKARLTLAVNTARRQKQLLTQNNVSQQRYDEALTNQRVASANVSAIEAALDNLDVQIDLSTIKAPFDGRIVRRTLDEGAVAAPGQVVFELIEDGALEFRVGIPADLKGEVTVRDTYPIETSTGTFDAELVRLVTSIDQATRTVLAIFSLEPGPDATLPAAGSLGRLNL
ncbi:MAG: efflux RND transporter periplasmic adaptor subunit, partial [Pseudomonadota bacterium]